MALQKQVIPIDFSGGLDKKADSKLVIPGKLTTLENGQFVSANTLSKRNGCTSQNADIVKAVALGTFGSELLALRPSGTQYQGHSLYSYIPGVPTWILRNGVPRDVVSVSPVIHNTSTQINQDAAISGTTSVVAWQDSRGGVRVSIFDESKIESSVAIVSDLSLSTTGVCPRLVVISGTFCCIYAEAGNLKMRSLPSVLAPTAWAAAVTLKTDVYAVVTQKFDACVRAGATYAYVGYCRSSDQGANIFKMDSAGTVTATTGAAFSAVAGVHVMPFEEVASSVALVHVAAAGALVVQCQVYDANLAGVTGTSNLAADCGFNVADSVVRITSYDNTFGLMVHMERVATVTLRRTIHCTFLVSNVAGSTNQGERLVGCSIASTPWIESADSTARMAVVLDSSLQSTLFIVGAEPSATLGVQLPILSKALVWKAGGAPTGVRVSNTFADYNAGRTIVAASKGRLAFSNGTNITPIGLTKVTNYTPVYTDHNHDNSFVDLDGTLLFPAAAASMYDGANIVEHGFHVFPEGLTGTQTNAGSLADGTYQIIACLEWVDAQGKLWRSIPSVPVTVVIAAGGGTARIIYLVPSLCLTSKTNVSVVFFRTLASGSIFYRVTSATSPVLNDPTVASATYTDGTADATLAANEALYTTGGVLERAGCPPCRFGTAHQGRFFVGGLEDGTIAYTEPRLDGEGMGFNEAYSLTLPAEGGKVTALASMDDKLMIGRKNRWEYVSGEGPNALGQQNGYSQAQLATGEMGPAEFTSRALCLTDDGLWFGSANGLRLLTRGLAIARTERGTFVGAEVDSLYSTPVAAVLDRSTSQIRFYDGTNALVYDQQWRQWSKFTNQACVDAVDWNGIPVHIQSGGVVRYKDSTLWADGGTAIPFTAETGWLAIAGVQGLQRVYDLLLLGTFYATATLTIEVGYNYIDTYQTPITITTGALFTVGVPMQLRYQLPFQKCEAVRFRIIETGGTANFALSSFALVVGTKKGSFKQISTKSVG